MAQAGITNGLGEIIKGMVRLDLTQWKTERVESCGGDDLLIQLSGPCPKCVGTIDSLFIRVAHLHGEEAHSHESRLRPSDDIKLEEVWPAVGKEGFGPKCSICGYQLVYQERLAVIIAYAMVEDPLMILAELRAQVLLGSGERGYGGSLTPANVGAR